MYGDFSSSSCLVIPAIKTGNLKVITNAVAREISQTVMVWQQAYPILVKMTCRSMQVNAKTVILAASTCESAQNITQYKICTTSKWIRQQQQYCRQIFT